MKKNQIYKVGGVSLFVFSVYSFLLCFCTLCFQAPLNTPRVKTTSNSYDEQIKTPVKETCILLAFSGGGTRAAALSFGVLKQLCLDNLHPYIHTISAVSGGSFTAAYFGLHKEKMFLDSKFKDNFLYKDIEWELSKRILVSGHKLLSWYFSRSDLIAEIYDELLFEGKTISELGNPFVVLNATDLESEKCFSFVQKNFDNLDSNINEYLISRAVASSAAFPGILTPITLKNYKGGYVHLIDGGVSDNTGISYLFYSYEQGYLRRYLATIENLVIIVVNAKTMGDAFVSATRTTPNTSVVLYKTATIAMNKYSLGIWEVFRERLISRKALQDRHLRLHTVFKKAPEYVQQMLGEEFEFPLAGNLDFFIIEVDLYQKNTKKFLKIPTSFVLPKQDVDALIDLGKETVSNSSEYARLLKKIKK